MVTELRMDERPVDVPDFEHAGRAGKTCTKCHKWQPLANFAKNRQAADGLTYWCRTCKSDYNRSLKGLPPKERPAAPARLAGVTIRPGWGVTTNAHAVAHAALAMAKEIVAPASSADTPEEQEEQTEPMELVDLSKSTMPKMSLDDFAALEEAPAVWIGPAGICVMAAPGVDGGAARYFVLSPYGDAPAFETTRDAAAYIVRLLVHFHASDAATLEGVMAYGGSARR